MRQRYILGVRVDLDMTMEDVVSLVEEWFRTDNQSRYICTTNPEFIMQAQRDQEFKNIINGSVLSLPDGVGILMADEYLTKVEKLAKDFLYPVKCLAIGIVIGLSFLFNPEKGKKRLTGVDLVYRLCQLSGDKGYSVFLLGGSGVGEKGEVSGVAAKMIKNKFDKVNIIGTSSQFTYINNDDDRTVSFIKMHVHESKTFLLDFLFVAYGQGNQEKWIVRNSNKIPVKISVGVGSSFDLIAGYNMSVRNIFKKLNLEWVSRLLVEPQRIVRIFRAFPIFPLKVFLESIK